MAADNAATCFPVADADLLGLGVRIGTYLQTLSAIINLHLNTDDAPAGAWVQVFGIVPIIAFALKFIIQGTISNSMFLATSYICWTQLLIMPVVLLMPAVRRFRLLFALISLTLVWNYGVQLWYFGSGYNRLEFEQCDQTSAFLFARVYAFGWYRIVNLVALALGAMMTVSLIAFMMMNDPVTYLRAQIIRRCENGLLVAEQQENPVEQAIARELLANALNDNFDGKSLVVLLRHILSYVLVPFLILSWIFIILGAELTLHWDNVIGVYSLDSTGQMIPLLVGAGLLARDVYFALPDPNRDEPRADGPEPGEVEMADLGPEL